MICDVCGHRDPYNGRGDGIGSCDCPRCRCGVAAGSTFCACEPADERWWPGDVREDEDDDGQPWQVGAPKPTREG